MKRIFAFALVLFMLCPVTAFANSAPTRWRGSDATGIITSDENCPIVVKKEELTFNISRFPESYHGEVDRFIGGSFTARYTLNNPTDMDISVRVFFPFGHKGDYYSDKFMTDSDFVKNNYKVTVDGKDVNAKRRYTFFPYNYDEFDITLQLEKLNDVYVGPDLFNPDRKVTKYVVDCGPGDENKELRIEWKNNNDGTYLYTGDYHKGNFRDGSVMLWADYTDRFVYYIIGDGTNRPQIKLYEKGKENLPRGESVQEHTTRTEMTLRQFIRRDVYNKFDGFDISENDMDNIIRDVFMHMSKGHDGRAFADNLNYYNIPADLMCWYDYEIEIPAGQTVVNTVTAPLFPDVNTGYNPDIYTYNYLLSPRDRWADFENLEIEVNTEYYMTESSLGEFEKTDTGYKNTFDVLPDGELAFTLSEGENPKKDVNYKYMGLFLPVLAIPVVVAIVLISMIRYVLKKKK